MQGGAVLQGRYPELSGTFRPVPRYLGMITNISDRSPRVLTPEQRRARDAVRQADAELAMREHEAAQKAVYDNLDRLRALRLAREAQASGK